MSFEMPKFAMEDKVQEVKKVVYDPFGIAIPTSEPVKEISRKEVVVESAPKDDEKKKIIRKEKVFS